MDIIVENLSKSFGKLKAVDAISFEAKKGQIIGLLGPNGAGKTTTLRMLSCFLFPDSGTVHIGKYDINKDGHKIKRHIGYLPELNPLYDEMNVVDFLIFIAQIHDIPKYLLPVRVMDMIRLCGLEDDKHKKIGELSRGFKQRVGLAQAFIHDPEILLLDEPTAGLDPNQIGEIREIIKHVAKDKTVIISSHILSDIETTCDSALILNKGKIVANGLTSELSKERGEIRIIQFSISKNGDINLLKHLLSTLPEIKKVTIVSEFSLEIMAKRNFNLEEMLFNICNSHGWFIKRLVPIESTLEDLFKKVTQN